MSGKTNKTVADSLETDELLLPHMPFLLRDIWALGCSLQPILDSIAALNLSPGNTAVLDLGCGKGAVSVRIASEFGFNVTGIDLMQPFLEDARKKAGEYHVSHLCEFIHKDIIEYVSAEHAFDLVVLASLGGVFGTLRDTVSRLRSQVKAGGYMIYDDGYLKQADSLNRKGYRHFRDHDTAIKELTFYGDRLVKEVNTSALSEEINAEYLTVIRHRGKELADQHPELEKNIRAYIQLQEEECDIINNRIEGALWLLRKTEH
ncbi:methyltransferase domain-containing protein [candidate division KSB1 bacterium]|nr:methyltransferase domain-containing protein [candidate division KSB1 bacterium]